MELIIHFVQASKEIDADTCYRINDCLKEIIARIMKEHELQIQTIIENTITNPLMRYNELFRKVHVEDESQKSHEKINANNEHLKQQVSNHNKQLDQFSSAISGNNMQTVSQAHVNEESELKYLLIKGELTKRQNMLDEVLLINEALQIKIKEYEVDNLNLPFVKIPTNTKDSSIQTDDSMESESLLAVTILNKSDCQHKNSENLIQSEIIKSIDNRQTVESCSVVSSIKSHQSNNQEEYITMLKNTIFKLKSDEEKRKKRIEKLVLKNLALKLEVCELKKEMKKYSNVWANDTYFNSLFLDSTRRMIRSSSNNE